MNKRERIHENRRSAARSLCYHKFGSDYTHEDYNRAYKLLERCIRYAIANDRFCESETERNWNSPYRKHKEELLWNRYQRLNKELEEFDAALNGSTYPQVTDKGGAYIICYLYSEYAD